ADFIVKSNFLKGELVRGDEFVSDAGLRVRCRRPSGLRRAVLAIRPEKIALTDAPVPGRVHEVPARIERPSYRRATRDDVVRRGTGEALIVHGVNGAGPTTLAAGGEVWASWEPEAAYLLPEEGAPPA